MLEHPVRHDQSPYGRDGITATCFDRLADGGFQFGGLDEPAQILRGFIDTLFGNDVAKRRQYLLEHSDLVDREALDV